MGLFGFLTALKGSWRARMGPKFTFNTAARSTLASARLQSSSREGLESPANGNGRRSLELGSLTPKRGAFNSLQGKSRSMAEVPGFLKATSASVGRRGVHEKSSDNLDGLDAEDARFEAEDSTWTCSKWLASLELHHVIAMALNLPDADQFDKVKALTIDDITQLLMDAKLEGLIPAISAGIELLQGQGASTGFELNDKFATEAKFEMKYGSLDLFYGGLE